MSVDPEAREGVARRERASSLCRACAFCCDGTLYTCVALVPEESKRLHLDVIDDRLPQPCAHLAGTSCGIYVDRPASCATYRCALLRKLDADEVTLEDAAGRVEEVRRLARQVELELPEGHGGVWDRVARADPEGTIRRAPPAELPSWVLAIGALRGCLVRDFADPWFADLEKPA